MCAISLFKTLTSAIQEWREQYHWRSKIQMLQTSWRDADHQTSSRQCLLPACSTWLLQLSTTVIWQLLQYWHMKMYRQPVFTPPQTFCSKDLKLGCMCGPHWNSMSQRAAFFFKNNKMQKLFYIQICKQQIHIIVTWLSLSQYCLILSTLTC